LAEELTRRLRQISQDLGIANAHLAHDPEKHGLDPDRVWEPIFGKDHALAKCWVGVLNQSELIRL
jgi:hypothetical protein